MTIECQYITVTCGIPSSNLIILEILLEQLSKQYPSHVDLDMISKLLDEHTWTTCINQKGSITIYKNIEN